MSADLTYHSRAVRAWCSCTRSIFAVRCYLEASLGSLSKPARERRPAYASLGALGQHVLGAAGGYMVWMCEVLELQIRDPTCPEATAIVRDAEEYMEHVLERCGPAM